MSTTDWMFLDAGLFIGALLRGDSRHAEARPIVEAARRGDFAACTSVGVLAEVYAALTWIGAQPTQTPEVAIALVSHGDKGYYHRTCNHALQTYKDSSFRIDRSYPPCIAINTVE